MNAKGADGMTGDDARDRDALVQAARSLDRTGNVGTSGNLSLRRPGGMLITPSGIPYGRLEPESLVFVHEDGTVGAPGQAAGSAADGEGPRPSSEWRFHRDIYAARPEAGAIVHCHSPHATALACLGRGIPAFHYEVAFAGGADIRCAPYATFGTQALSEHVVAALADRRACLLANHGMVCFETDLERAMALALEVEQLARIYGLCLSMGTPELLPADEMERVLARFADYGPRRED